MTKILSLDNPLFGRIGTYAFLAPPSGEPMGDKERGVRFWPDLLKLPLGKYKGHPVNAVSIGLCAAKPRDSSTDPLEFHRRTSEGILAMNADIILILAQPGAKDPLRESDILAVRVPKYTMVVLKRGAWHWAPLPVGKEEVFVPILLPRMTYNRDLFLRYLSFPLELELTLTVSEAMGQEAQAGLTNQPAAGGAPAATVPEC